jgi:hypothetical protein
MKRIFILLLLPIWLPVLVLMRLFHIGDLSKEEIARRRFAAQIGSRLVKARKLEFEHDNVD